MKKKFVVALGMLLCVSAVCLTSCSKDDDDDEDSCTCTRYEDGDVTEKRQISPSSFGAKNCSDLATVMESMADYGISFSCR